LEIRTFQRGDEAIQAAIYNEAAADFPKFKPAGVAEVSRRVTSRDFDPTMRFFALKSGQPVAYVVFNRNGRVGFPWCRKGHEELQEPLFQHMMNDMARRGFHKAFTAYRSDWPMVLDFFQKQGFVVARETVNFVLDILDLPTLHSRPKGGATPLMRSDVPALFAMAPHVIRCTSPADLERYLFDNSYFPSEAVFVLRGTGGPLGAGILINNGAYAHPKAVDSAMPCFRLGAFGTEGMQTKRINGLFSFLCPDEPKCGSVAVELLEHATSLVQDSDEIVSLGAQVPTDAPNWLRFYQLSWRRQGSFPVLERNLVV
jgi:hypothetical protein